MNFKKIALAAIVVGATTGAAQAAPFINGTIGFFSGGTLTVKIGNRLFATVVITESDVTITGRDGGALSAEDEETLYRIFDWFESAFGVPDALLGPLFTVLDVDGI